MPSYSYRTVREDVRVPLPDGTELYARPWRPVTDDPVPVVLEYSGGRLTDWTVADDARRHPWYAGHGYAAVRVDARGRGNSGGRPDDGAGEQDLTDGADLLRRLAAEPWCTPTHFLTRTQLTALEAGDIVFTREWQQQIPRTAP
ncbi:CocE/NonD family hydrolase [Kitasatospora sp. NPDC058263]